jgi:pyruvate/2-oxoglutarate dehydrogenase complex dihydrolipoamide acyltransferase (E2) component
VISEIHIPLLGMNMKEATIVNWLVENGGKAEKDYALVEIETDKAVHEIVSPASGVLKVVREKATIVPVGGLIGLVGPTMEACETALAQIGPKDSPETEDSMASAPPVAAPSPAISKGGSIRISGIARKMAETHGIDLSRIQPSDPGGRISKEDVERAIQTLEKSKATASAGAGLQSSLKTREKIPFAGKKRAMAQRLTESLQVMAQMTNWEDVDMSRILEIKNSGVLEKTGSPYRLTLNDFFVKLMAQALKEYPLLNASLVGEELCIWDDINIAAAVAVGEDLVTPVIRNVDQKPVQQIGQELGAMVAKARENRLSFADISDSTISITNIGALGANPGTPIIQIPHAAIIGFGAVEKKPVVVEDQIVIRPMLFMAVTVDHRFVTGAVSARFRKRLKALIENADREMLEKTS